MARGKLGNRTAVGAKKNVAQKWEVYDGKTKRWRQSNPYFG